MKIFKILFFSLFLCIFTIGLGIKELRANPNCTQSIPELYEQISPSVVFMSASSIDPFKVINRVRSSIGSGFVFSKEGLILTNSHVVFGRQLIVVTLDDGNKVIAKVLGLDPILDLAILKIPAPSEGLSSATLGDSDGVQIGEEVLAIGNPLGFEQTLTRGIIPGSTECSRSLP